MRKKFTKKPHIDFRKIDFNQRSEVARLLECAECLYSVVLDVMPQIGGLALQDYAALNHGLLLAEHLFGSPNNKR